VHIVQTTDRVRRCVQPWTGWRLQAACWPVSSLKPSRWRRNAFAGTAATCCQPGDVFDQPPTPTHRASYRHDHWHVVRRRCLTADDDRWSSRTLWRSLYRRPTRRWRWPTLRDLTVRRPCGRRWSLYCRRTSATSSSACEHHSTTCYYFTINIQTRSVRIITIIILTNTGVHSMPERSQPASWNKEETNIMHIFMNTTKKY